MGIVFLRHYVAHGGAIAVGTKALLVRSCPFPTIFSFSNLTILSLYRAKAQRFFNM